MLTETNKKELREYLIRNDDYTPNPYDSSISKTVNKVKCTVRFEPECQVICTSTLIDKKYKSSIKSDIPLSIVKDIRTKTKLYLLRFSRLHNKPLKAN